MRVTKERAIARRRRGASMLEITIIGGLVLLILIPAVWNLQKEVGGAYRGDTASADDSEYRPRGSSRRHQDEVTAAGGFIFR